MYRNPTKQPLTQPLSHHEHFVDAKRGRTKSHLVAVGVRLVRAIDLDANVLSLLSGEDGQLGSELAEVKAGNLLVQDLQARTVTEMVSETARGIVDGS